jgi:hypothetical protein
MTQPRNPTNVGMPAYQAAHQAIIDSKTPDGLKALQIRCSRHTDNYPMVGLFFNLLVKAIEITQELLRNREQSDPKQWGKDYFEAMMTASRIEGALAAYMAAAEENYGEEYLTLRDRAAAAIKMLIQASQDGLVDFPKPTAFNIKHIIDTIDPPINPSQKNKTDRKGTPRNGKPKRRRKS